MVHMVVKVSEKQPGSGRAQSAAAVGCWAGVLDCQAGEEGEDQGNRRNLQEAAQRRAAVNITSQVLGKNCETLSLSLPSSRSLSLSLSIKKPFWYCVCVFCSIHRLFVYLRMRMPTSKQQSSNKT